MARFFVDFDFGGELLMEAGSDLISLFIFNGTWFVSVGSGGPGKTRTGPGGPEMNRQVRLIDKNFVLFVTWKRRWNLD